MKKYNIVAGLIGSLFISLLIFIPRPFRGGFTPSADTMLYSFFYALGCWLVIQFTIQNKIIKTHFQKVTLGLLGCLLLSIVMYRISGLFTDLPLLDLMNQISEQRKLVFVHVRGLIVGSFLFFIAYMQHLASLAQHMKLEIEKIRQENLQALLWSLQQQVNPHFLFNSLNTLRSMATDKSVKMYVQQLSNVYRYLLSNSGEILTTLKEELAFTNAYLHILKERYEGALLLTIAIPDDVLMLKVPPVTLQLLIENAVKHNIVSVEDPLHISIICPNENSLVVSNNLQLKLSDMDGVRIGLQNISERYLLLSDKLITIEKTKESFTVTIPLLP